MGIFDELADKAKDLFEDNKDKIGGLVHSEQAEGISDKVIGGAGDLADKVTGGKFSDQIDAAQQAADGAVGNE